MSQGAANSLSQKTLRAGSHAPPFRAARLAAHPSMPLSARRNHRVSPEVSRLGHTTRFFTIVINKRHRRSSDPPVTKSVPLPRWLPIESSPARPWRLPGGGERDRTDDLLLAKQALSQLSYTPRAKGGGSCAREGAARAARRRIELLSAPAPFGETACRPPGSVCCANAGGGPGRI